MVLVNYHREFESVIISEAFVTPDRSFTRQGVVRIALLFVNLFQIWYDLS